MGAPTERNLPNKPTSRSFFFGDSICFGQGVSLHFAWVIRLSRALDARFSSRADVLTQNPSVNGNTTRMALERMPYDVQSHAPDVLYIQFGLNDCNGWEADGGVRGFRGTPSRPTSGKWSIAVISSAPSRSSLAPIIRPHELRGFTSITPYEEANGTYNAIIRQVAGAKGTLLADAEVAFDEAVNAGRGAVC